jgi:glycosyltransferase involved in cell wall biosynthesis
MYLPFLFDEIDIHQQQKWKYFEKREHFIFIGNFMHKPNVAAVLSLKNEIWSKIRKGLPKAEIHVYGAYTNQQIEQLHNEKEGFIIKGFVEDAAQVVGNAKVVLAPLSFGAGIKGKLTEAMLCGTPSITTSIGAEGMYDEFPWNGFIEDNFADFAIKAKELYLNKPIWKQAQLNGVTIINSIYNKEKNGKLFFNKIHQIEQNIEKHRVSNFLGSLLQYKTLQASKYMSKWIEQKNRLIH